jgi:cation transport ATPase
MTANPAPSRFQDAKVARFEIGGMHCAACAFRNEETLKRLPGVREAVVNFALRNARVEFDPAQIDENALRAAVTGNGFEVLERERISDHRRRAEREVAVARWRAIIALLLAAPVIALAMLEVELPWDIAAPEGGGGQDHLLLREVREVLDRLPVT